ncbi:Hypothetical_protein [Hexamita inflata]|uniref:Hypothetical_protein n=1 Tax=Hexamita inflata TaxID=28002 RepID=A0AA86TDR9_9EUKA|nr:Hypothetical protein HINF_LOCUS1157 [Hexamita inflata]
MIRILSVRSIGATTNISIKYYYKRISTITLKHTHIHTFKTPFIRKNIQQTKNFGKQNSAAGTNKTENYFLKKQCELRLTDCSVGVCGVIPLCGHALVAPCPFDGSD